MNHDEAAEFWETMQTVSEITNEYDQRWPLVMQRLNATIPGLALTSLGGAVPIQGEGTYEGELLYFRARFTQAMLSVGTSCPPAQRPKVYKSVRDETKSDGWPYTQVPTDEIDELGAVIRYPARGVSLRVTEEDDEYGAGWLTPEEVEAIFPVLIESLHPITYEDSLQREDESNAFFAELVQTMKAANENPEIRILSEDELLNRDLSTE